MIRRGIVLSVDTVNVVASVQLDDGSVVAAGWVNGYPSVGATVVVDSLGSASWVVLGTVGAPPWEVPWGELLYTEQASGLTSATTFDIMSGSVPITPGRRIKFTAHCQAQKTNNAGDLTMEITDAAGNRIAADVTNLLGVNEIRTHNAGPRVITTDASTATGWKVRYVVSTNGIALNVAADAPGTFLVEDIGPA